MACAKERPLTTAGAAIVGGGGAVVAGQAIASLGSGVMAVGGAITVLNGLGAAVAAGTGCAGLAGLQVRGVGIGMGIVLAGAGMCAAGHVATAAGVASIGAGAVAGAYGTQRAIRERKQNRICEAEEVVVGPARAIEAGSES